MFGTVLVLLLAANLNAQPAEDYSVEARETAAAEITLLELELQSMYDRNAAPEEIVEGENQLSDLYNQDEDRNKLIAIGCKIFCAPFICSGHC